MQKKHLYSNHTLNSCEKRAYESAMQLAEV